MVVSSCERMINWLDTALKNWRIEGDSHVSSDEPETIWQLSAAGQQPSEFDNHLKKTFAAIHRARSGPVRGVLTKHMGDAQSPVLPAFAGSLEIEGRLQLEFKPEAGRGLLHAAVAAPEIV